MYESYLDSPPDILQNPVVRKYASPEPPNWCEPGEHPLTLEPYLSPNGVLSIGNSGLLIDLGQPNSLNDPSTYNWELAFKPDGSYSEKDRNVFKNTAVFSAAILVFLNLYGDLVQQDPKYSRAYLIGETNRPMFKFRERVFNDLVPGSILRLEGDYTLAESIRYRINLYKMLNSYRCLQSFPNINDQPLLVKLGSRAKVGEWQMLTKPTGILGS